MKPSQFCQRNALNRALEWLVMSVEMGVKYPIRGLNSETFWGCAFHDRGTVKSSKLVTFQVSVLAMASYIFQMCVTFFILDFFFYSGSFKVAFSPPPLPQRTVLIIF